MQIKTGKYNSIDEADEYLHYLVSCYSHCNGFEYFLGDLKKALYYTIHSTNQNATYLIISGQEGVLAHTLLIEDKRLVSGEALFGFFECKNNKDIFLILWNKLSELAQKKNITIIKGPINGTIWHQYRVIKKSDKKIPYFNSEPLSMNWYYFMLKEMNPVEEVNYYSGMREQYDTIIDITKPSCEKLLEEGYIFKHIEVPSRNQVRVLYRLSAEVFKNNWGFTKIDEKEFESLYSTDKIKKHIGQIHFAYEKNELVGFCSTVRDRNNLIMKTIAVVPHLQGKGIGNALVYLAHHMAKENGMKRIVYALVRDTNKVQYFPKDDVILFREYACFTFILK
jgi:ribosomal protein S18 acetylase RimI-like enzyme